MENGNFTLHIYLILRIFLKLRGYFTKISLDTVIRRMKNMGRTIVKRPILFVRPQGTSSNTSFILM